MLHEDVVEEKTYSLLKRLMSDSSLTKFNLVGGTALSLHLGHRKSVDLDLFTQTPFDAYFLMKHLSDNYGFVEGFIENNTLKGTIDHVYVDMLSYDYPFVKPLCIYEKWLRILDLTDLSAMKLSAITDSGTRLKDFVDISFLSSRMSLNDMLLSYEKKFKNSNVISVLKALTYYDDIQNDIIHLTKGHFDIRKIQNRLSDMKNYPSRVFEDFPIKEDN